ncbi:hypothetical protein HBI56_143940 [Parastagonospora nodorum]|uniref:Uncharacterized protein n=1 Tax=Phaeosphaeria nodorum (strain SN15 / ATCC MYA-4574 / FGSC 10173) TaxID=321614 RepID=A0A7U2F9Q5_PHANO|nr:hypothetical protein HBH56_033110 [Parastagonospora nodorum]QRD00264.1 hypothetical protein JI435_414930 [Parastagonospora nodorum SN15]KAH3933633.1 hypothetical protein HBH54_066320 [Parastagonospora nodorum]KAH3952484.1 hypothetical protein HBH53_043710 [Parastagonospora nodorum]KAH3979808.1 hypothetical protein HBH51_054740 [Parastagonospora nodorum]
MFLPHQAPSNVINLDCWPTSPQSLNANSVLRAAQLQGLLKTSERAKKLWNLFRLTHDMTAPRTILELLKKSVQIVPRMVGGTTA